MSQIIENEPVTENLKGQRVPYTPPQDQKIYWPATLFIVAAHIIALAGFFTFTWPAFILCIVFNWVTGGVGITLGFHRLLTHRSFKTPKFMEYFLAICGNLACQGGPISWVVTHRLHHLYSDQERDPHTPLVNFLWAHILWTFKINPAIYDKEIQMRLAPDLLKDRGMQFLEKTHILWTVLLAIGFYAWGGWPFVVWGIFVRLVMVYHATWFVNSATHVWGYRTYRSSDRSTNLWWVALLTYGEGWHNNHHAFQTSARHGLEWWEFDSTYLMIQTMELFGLAKDIKIPSKHLLATKLLEKNSGVTAGD